MKFKEGDKVLPKRANPFFGVGVLTLGVVLERPSNLGVKVFFPSLDDWWVVPPDDLILLERKGVEN